MRERINRPYQAVAHQLFKAKATLALPGGQQPATAFAATLGLAFTLGN